MTHNDIYTKFMIEYDKANVTSSYPSLTEYEVATILDKAYLTLIARKLTGNNNRRASFEYDTKAIEDLRPLVKTSTINFKATGTNFNEYIYALPDNMMYYLLGIAKFTKSSYDRELLTTVDHKIANNFKITGSNIPWMKNSVVYLEDDGLHILVDPYKHNKLSAPALTVTYIKTPKKFVIDTTAENNQYPGTNTDITDNSTWVIYSKEIPSSINNSLNSSSFKVYYVKNTLKSTCTIDVISGSDLIKINETPNDIYGFIINVLNTGTIELEFSCTSDPTISTRKQISVKYNAPANTDEEELNPNEEELNPGGENLNPGGETTDPVVPPSTGYNFVDLGLPSGTKWADRNFGATSVTDRGKFYGWGDPTGEKISQTDSYGNIGLTPPVDLTQSHQDLDIVHENLHDNWHTPTSTQMLELINNCTWTHKTNYMNVEGLDGYEVRGKGNYINNYIFIPHNGCRSGVDTNGNPIYSSNTNESYYWSSELTDNPYGYGVYVKLLVGTFRAEKEMTFYGMYIRPVYNESSQTNNGESTTVVTQEGLNVRMVDLGLSVLWADRNIGASVEGDKGDYIAWGETQEKEVYRLNNYLYNQNSSIVEGNYLKSQYDAATQRWGSLFRMPTEDEIDELILNCNCTWERHIDSLDNLIEGMRYTSKINGLSIFLPATGYTAYDYNHDRPYIAFWEIGRYWSNTTYTQGYARCLMFSDPDGEYKFNSNSSMNVFIGLPIRPVSPKQITQ